MRVKGNFQVVFYDGVLADPVEGGHGAAFCRKSRDTAPWACYTSRLKRRASTARPTPPRQPRDVPTPNGDGSGRPRVTPTDGVPRAGRGEGVRREHRAHDDDEILVFTLVIALHKNQLEDRRRENGRIRKGRVLGPFLFGRLWFLEMDSQTNLHLPRGKYRARDPAKRRRTGKTQTARVAWLEVV